MKPNEFLPEISKFKRDEIAWELRNEPNELSQHKSYPRMIRLHYFRNVDPDTARLYGMKKDRNGNFYLPQYDKSGRTFDYHWSSLRRMFGDPRTIDLKENLLNTYSAQYNEQANGQQQDPQQQISNLELAHKQAQQITKTIKYDDTAQDILVKVKMLGEKYGIPDEYFKDAEDEVFAAMRQLESAVYGLDEVFENVIWELKNRYDIDEGQIYSTGGGPGQAQRWYRPQPAGMKEGEVIPFKRPNKMMTWEQLPPDVLHLANEWYWADDENSSFNAVSDREGYGNGTSNKVRMIKTQLAQKGWDIDHNDENDKKGEFNIILKNKNGQTILLPVEDAQNFTGWAKGTSDEVREARVNELKCWPGYTRVRGVPAGAPGSCKKKTKESSIMKGIQSEEKNEPPKGK